MFRHRHQLRSAIDSLEARTVPAGLLNATFNAGVLNIVGDAAANTLTLTQTADGRLTLTTDIGTALKVNGQNVSGFLGHTLASPVTGGVTINLGDGPDMLTISGQNADIDLPSFLTINGGAGNNLVTFQQGVTVGGNLTITHGLGSDTTYVNQKVTVLGNMTINNGHGGSLLAGTDTEWCVNRRLTVNSGTGKDVIDFSNGQHITLGSWVLKTGNDTDGSKTDCDPIQTLTVKGSVLVQHGNGDDDLDLGDGTPVTQFMGPITINNGGGNNHTDLAGSTSLTASGAIVVNGGPQSDLVHLGINSGQVTFGRVTANNGGGSNGVVLAGADLTIDGNVLIVGGAHTDDIDVIANNAGMITGSVTAKLGAGQNILEMNSNANLTIGGSFTFSSQNTSTQTALVDLRRLKIQGKTTITMGAGNDFVTINDVQFNGAVSFVTGAGKDTVNIEQLTYAGHTQFNQAVTINTGADDDKVYVSGVMADAEQKTVFAHQALFNGGPGNDLLQLNGFGANIFYGAPAQTIGF